jgi:hypothetical protein
LRRVKFLENLFSLILLGNVQGTGDTEDALVSIVEKNQLEYMRRSFILRVHRTPTLGKQRSTDFVISAFPLFSF